MDDMQTSYAKMLDGRLYLYPAEMANDQARCLELQYDYNATRPCEGEKRQALLKQMFASVGEGCYIEPPLRANWAGKFVHLGNSVYANFNLTLVDDCEITIGDHVMIGPNVTLTVAGHPIVPELRDLAYQFNMPIHIGSHVWIGAGVIVLPGVTIGDNCVIGAGSVVTHDIPDNSIALGTPCRVVRQVSEHDYEYYWHDHKIEPEDLKVIEEYRKNQK